VMRIWGDMVQLDNILYLFSALFCIGEWHSVGFLYHFSWLETRRSVVSCTVPNCYGGLK